MNQFLGDHMRASSLLSRNEHSPVGRTRAGCAATRSHLVRSCTVLLRRLADEITAVLALPEVKTRLAELGYEADPQGPAAFGEFIKKENEHWGTVIRLANIKAD